MPCTESVTCWLICPRKPATRCETARFAPEPSQAFARLATNPAAATSATGHEAIPPMVRIPITGTVTAVTAGGKVCAKKTSIRSMSLVARTSRSPEVERCISAGVCGTSA